MKFHARYTGRNNTVQKTSSDDSPDFETFSFRFPIHTPHRAHTARSQPGRFGSAVSSQCAGSLCVTSGHAGDREGRTVEAGGTDGTGGTGVGAATASAAATDAAGPPDTDPPQPSPPLRPLAVRSMLAGATGTPIDGATTAREFAPNWLPPIAQLGNSDVLALIFDVNPYQ